MTNPGSFPVAALDWLAPPDPGRVLAIGKPSAVTANRLAGRGNTVVISDKSASAARSCRHRFPDLRTVAAAPDSLPFAPRSFDSVLVAQGIHLMAAGLALDEYARVLASGGHLAVLHTVRDDSVPWVRRLAAVLREYDPEAMSGHEDLRGVDSIAASPRFPQLEHRSFRLWLPITREGLTEMVSSSPVIAALEQADVDRLIAEVNRLYDASARPPEPLLLPYSVLCWRATVDHGELSEPLREAEDILQIRL